MLEVIDSADVLHTILNLPDKQGVGKLLKYLLELLPPITSLSGKFDITNRFTKNSNWSESNLYTRAAILCTLKDFPNLYLSLDYHSI